ncbi:ABC-type antimicrobial peptide transport system, permease component [Maribacter dokdonensis]|uniref:ABC-type antimicrobial peptide transport system, permease component n=1 Tax=Maribacter dokdonensis TaxID=320912 RepID=A0A1H4K4F5_9FLAO|nr:ABC transporter permease [Maribacter dokdonensis]SEB53449.1 ABC-type antimicrobial peptide transport system, permease component [Maribacter dokdonensis]
MLRNYLKIAFRNVWKNKVFSIINILGLSIGLSAAFVIGAMVFYNLTFDNFHQDGKRIYRVTTSFEGASGVFHNAGVAVPLAQELKDLKMEEIETVAPFFTIYPLHVENSATGNRFKDPEFVIYTEPSYFQTFEYNWLAGNSQTALEEPNMVVLSQERAKKYFPNQEIENIIGKTLVYNDSIHTTVSGVIAGFNGRTDIVFEEFISLKTADTQDMTNAINEADWNNTNSASQLFIKLSENTSADNVQKTLTQIADDHNEPEDTYRGGSTSKFNLQPLNDLHLNPNYGTFDFNDSRTTMSALKSLMLLALILLILGCINFINLNTAQAIKRAKEIGIRKTLGSSRFQLISQYLGETFLLTLSAAVVSFFLSKWLLLLFSDFIPAGLSFDIFLSPWLVLGVFLLLGAVTILSGFYPALVLSKYKPVSVLKQQITPSSDKGLLRKYLTVFQFVIAQIFIIATLMVGKQLNYIMKKDMGFNTDAIAYFKTPWQDTSAVKRTRFVNRVQDLPGISSAVLAGNPPASFTTMSMGVKFIDDSKEVNSDLQLMYGTANYFDLYNLKLLAGRMPLNDSINEFVVNTSYLKVVGVENAVDIIGKNLVVDGDNLPIVGVMDDFNQHSLKYGVSPMAFTGSSYTGKWTQFKTIHFKLNPNQVSNWSETISSIESIWKETYPESDFKYAFMDDTVKQFYESEQKTATLLKWATGLAILISCLGLFGLVVHTTERRTKEIGIRKILGANIFQLNILLSKDFLKLVLIAFVIAAPIAWYGLHSWLEEFANKTELSWWVFALSGILMVVISLLIMTIKTLNSANNNPIKSLRTE